MIVLKFLAYDPDVGIFEPDFIHEDGYAYVTIKGVSISTKQIMQYTGISDKDGDPIYSGHIVLAYGIKWTIIFQEGAYWAVNKKRRMGLRTVHCKIIGNIYKN